MKPENTRSVQELIHVIENGLHPEYLFFWGHNPKIAGRIDESCLSNWYPAQFRLEGIEYKTTEHYMMSEKARLFGDEKIQKQILQARTPAEAKSLGRKVSCFVEDIWHKHRFEIVVRGNTGKFSQNGKLGEFLVHTGNRVLVEASPNDRIWGIGMGKNHQDREKPEEWNGLNLLGFALMEVREKL